MSDTKKITLEDGTPVPEDLREMYDKANAYGVAQYKGGDWPQDWSHEKLVELIEDVARAEARLAEMDTRWKAQCDEAKRWRERAQSGDEAQRLTEINTDLVKNHNTHVVICARQKERIALLEAREKRLREALEAIIRHQLTIGGSIAENGTVVKVARAALNDKEEGQ